jgi:hypothetical protein
LFGSVDGGRADTDVDGDRFVGGFGISGEQDLSSLDLANCPLAALHQVLKLLALVRSQCHAMAYIHGDL